MARIPGGYCVVLTTYVTDIAAQSLNVILNHMV